LFEPSLRMATSRSILRTCRRSLRHSSVPDSPTHTAVAARYPQLFSPFHNSPELWAPPPSLRAGTQFPFAHSATGHPHFAAEGFVQRRASPPDPAASTHRPLPSRTSSAMKRSELHRLRAARWGARAARDGRGRAARDGQGRAARVQFVTRAFYSGQGEQRGVPVVTRDFSEAAPRRARSGARFERGQVPGSGAGS